MLVHAPNPTKMLVPAAAIGLITTSILILHFCRIGNPLSSTRTTASISSPFHPAATAALLPQKISLQPTPRPPDSTHRAESPALTEAETEAKETNLNPAGIPRKIWYKLGPLGLSAANRQHTASCIDANPLYSYQFMTDASSDQFVQNYYAADHPGVVTTYLAIPIPIVRADFLRYLLLHAHGGMWSDLDVSCDGPPIDDWIPPKFHESNVGLVVGWEFDRYQFASWTFLARPHNPHLWAVILDIIEDLHYRARINDVGISGLTKPMVHDIVDVSGPARLSRSVVRSVEARTGRRVDWDGVSGLLVPKLLVPGDDVLVLPGYAFARSMHEGVYNETLLEEMGVGTPLVTHHYAGSWKNGFGGEEVPLEGRV